MKGFFASVRLSLSHPFILSSFSLLHLLFYYLLWYGPFVSAATHWFQAEDPSSATKTEHEHEGTTIDQLICQKNDDTVWSDTQYDYKEGKPHTYTYKQPYKMQEKHRPMNFTARTPLILETIALLSVPYWCLILSCERQPRKPPCARKVIWFGLQQYVEKCEGRQDVVTIHDAISTSLTKHVSPSILIVSSQSYNEWNWTNWTPWSCVVFNKRSCHTIE